MINITENISNKITGLTSLYVDFNYDAKIVDIMRNLKPSNYDKITKIWETSNTNLAYLLDTLTYFDDITLKLYIKPEETIIEKKSESEFKTKPFKYQLEGINYGLNHDKWLLLDQCGLGKSLTSIYLAEELYNRGLLEHCLVICGINSLKPNWEREIKKHSKLTSRIVGKIVTKTGSTKVATIPERAEELLNPIEEFFIIINVEMLREDCIINAINNSKNNIGMIILDEAHKAKGMSSKQGENLLKLEDFKYKLAMTGTPIVNSPLDMYVSLSWIGKEKSCKTKFKEEYCIYDGKIIVGLKNQKLLKEVINECSLRRTKDILKEEGNGLPEKQIIREVLEMDPKQRKLYEAVKKGIKEECDKISLKKANAKSILIRLREATSCPEIISSQDITSVKLLRAVELVDEITSNDDKVVIFSCFKSTLNTLKEMLNEYNPLMGTGDMKTDEVENNINTFQEDEEHKVFLGTVQRMGTGLTLNKARYAIFIDCPWTATDQEQCEDRVHRIGSKDTVFIYRLMCEDTIDTAVDTVISRKKSLGEYLVDDNEDENVMEILKDYIVDL